MEDIYLTTLSQIHKLNSVERKVDCEWLNLKDVEGICFKVSFKVVPGFTDYKVNWHAPKYTSILYKYWSNWRAICNMREA
jgi:hypothetical protein